VFIIGFSGGGTSGITAHVHTNAAGQGGALDDTTLCNAATLLSQLGNWRELARTKLTVAGDVIDVSFTARENLMVLMHIINVTDPRVAMTFNGDTGNNYAYRNSEDGSADTTQINQPDLRITQVSLGQGLSTQLTILIRNIGASPKLVWSDQVGVGTAGAGNATMRRLLRGKWVNSSDQINQITATNTRAGHDYGIDSEIIVMGFD